MADELKRRDFLKTTAAAAVTAGPAVISARGANDKISDRLDRRGHARQCRHRLAQDGRGRTVQLKAVCDTYQGYIARAKDRVKTIWGNMPDTYEDYHELLADKSIDAVFIMTPEHLHHNMAIAALRAGKHVYVEKPLAHTIEEGWDIVREWKKSGKVVPGGHAEPQLLALQEGQGDGAAGHDRRRSLRARLLVPQLAPRTIPRGATPFPTTPTRSNTDWTSSSGPRPSGRSTSTATSSGGCTGITPAASPPTCWCTRPTSSISCSSKTVPKSCMASGGIYRWTESG